MSDKKPTFLIEPILNEDETKVSIRATARFVESSAYKAVSVESIIDTLEKRGYGKYRLSTEAVEEIVIALSEAETQIKSQDDIQESKIESDVIAEAFNATGEVEISDGKMSAVLSITSAEGGKDLSLKEVLQLLEDAGVSYGIDDEKITELLTQVRQSEAAQTNSEMVAVAREPVKGKDTEFIPLVETANERVLKPKLRDDGTVDMLDLGDLATVSENTALMQKVPPEEGSKGVNVCYEFLAAEMGDDLTFKPGPGTKVSEDDELILVSTISGQPNLTDRGMKVDDAVQVSAVDLSTGHMTLDANLMVKGDITEGMKVRCKGDITVGGLIECADVIADGNIIIGKGIIGRTPDHSEKNIKYKVSVQAKGSLSFMFASYAKISAGGDINVAEQLLHCNTFSKSKIKVGNEKTVGSQIVGGFTRSDVSIEADILGASAGILTQFDMNGIFEIKHYEVVCNRSITEGKTQMLSNMRNAYSKFMNIPQNDTVREHMRKIKNTINFLNNEVQELEERTLTMLLEGEEVCKGLTITAKKKIQPNVVVKIGHGKYKNNRERAPGDIHYEEGEIHYEPSL